MDEQNKTLTARSVQQEYSHSVRPSIFITTKINKANQLANAPYAMNTKKRRPHYHQQPEIIHFQSTSLSHPFRTSTRAQKRSVPWNSWVRLISRASPFRMMISSSSLNIPGFLGRLPSVF